MENRSPKEKSLDIIETIRGRIDESDFHVPEFITGIETADGSAEYDKVYNYESELLSINLALEQVKTVQSFGKILGLREPMMYWNSIESELNKMLIEYL